MREQTLADLLQDLVHENNPKELVELFGFKMENGKRKTNKSIGQLYKEVAGNSNGAKLGVYDWITLMKGAGDFRSYLKMSDELGFIAMPKNANPDGKNYHHEITQAVAVFGDIIREANKPDASAFKILTILAQLHKEVSDIAVRIEKGERA